MRTRPPWQTRTPKYQIPNLKCGSMYRMSAPTATHRRGRKPKGDRAPFSGKLPRTHLDMYRALAEQQGVPLADYIAAALAEHHGLEEPDYLSKPGSDQPQLLAG